MTVTVNCPREKRKSLRDSVELWRGRNLKKKNKLDPNLYDFSLSCFTRYRILTFNHCFFNDSVLK